MSLIDKIVSGAAAMSDGHPCPYCGHTIDHVDPDTGGMHAPGCGFLDLVAAHCDAALAVS